MKDFGTAMEQASGLHVNAAAALKIRDYKLAESLYRLAIERVTEIFDPLHTDYVEMLKGLRTCLHMQDKAEEVSQVDLMIAQLCIGQ